MTRASTKVQHNLIKFLRGVNYNINPISYKYKETSTEEIKECLSRIHSYYKDVDNEFKENFPIKVVFPSLFDIDDWFEWKIGELDLKNYLSVFNIKEVNERINKLPGQGFSRLLIRERDQSPSKDIPRIHIIVPEDFEIENYHLLAKIANLHKLDISQSVKYGLAERLELKNYDQPSTKQSDSAASLDNCEHEGYVGSFKEHKVFLNEGLILIYVLSETIEIEGRKKSLGGVHYLIDSSMIQGDRALDVLNELCVLTDKIAMRIANRYQSEALKEQSRVASISRVLNRNLAHNIGSHVLANITEKNLSKAAQKLKPKVKGENLEKYLGPVTLNLTEFLSTRMEFLADLSTQNTKVKTSFGFEDVIKNAFPNNGSLVESLVSGTDYPCTVKLKNSEDDNINCVFPNGELGKHALYTIIENVIRNSAKHSRRNDQSDGKIQIELTVAGSDDKGLYRLHLWDAGSAKCDQNVADNINSDLENAVIDDRGELRDKAWGFIEMKAAAAYLRSIPLEQIDKPWASPCDTRNGGGANPEQPPLLRALLEDNKLAYEFYLEKPKAILLITEGKDSIEAFVNDENDVARPCEVGTNYKPEAYQLVCCDRTLADQLNGLKAVVVAVGNGEQLTADECWQAKLLELKTEGGLNVTDSIELKQIEYGSIVNQSDEQNSNTCEKNKICIVNHAPISDLSKLGAITTPLESINALGFYYFRNSSGTYFQDQLISNYKKDTMAQVKLLEATFLKVGIIDERIQGQCEVQTAVTYPILESMKIIVPKKSSIDLKSEEQLISCLFGEIEKMLDENDIVVVHFGLLEKVFSNHQDYDGSLSQRWCKFLEIEFIKNNCDKLVLTSGRGQIKGVALDQKFINHASLRNNLFDKFSLAQSLLFAEKI